MPIAVLVITKMGLRVHLRAQNTAQLATLVSKSSWINAVCMCKLSVVVVAVSSGSRIFSCSSLGIPNSVLDLFKDFYIYIYYEIVQIVPKTEKGLTINYGLQIQSIKDLTKSSSNWSKQKAPSRTLISSSRTSVVLIKSQLIKL